MTTQISRNGVDITSPDKPEVPVMVGEPNQMGVTFSPLPPDAAPPTYQWTIPGDKIKNFEETAGNPDATPPTFSMGKKVELPAVDLQTTSPRFFWYNGTFAGDSKEVKVDITVDGETFTLKGKCKIYRPKFNSLTGIYTNERPQSYLLGGSVRFGNPGITFNADVQTPNVANAAGSIAFEQIVTYNYAIQGKANDTPYSISKSANNALDSVDPDPIYLNAVSGIAAGSTANATVSDSPGIGINGTDDHLQASGSFKTYLVYKPGGTGSMWVVLGNFDWSFAFTAFYKNDDPTVMPTWVVTTTAPSGTTPNSIGSDTYDLPEWSMRGQEAKWTTVTP